MDTGKGQLVEISELKFAELSRKGATGLFREGGELEFNGSKFIIKKIFTGGRMMIKVLSH